QLSRPKRRGFRKIRLPSTRPSIRRVLLRLISSNTEPSVSAPKSRPRLNLRAPERPQWSSVSRLQAWQLARITNSELRQRTQPEPKQVGNRNSRHRGPRWRRPAAPPISPRPARRSTPPLRPRGSQPPSSSNTDRLRRTGRKLRFRPNPLARI